MAKAQDMSSQQLSATVSDLTLPGYNYHYWICKKLRNANKEWLLWSETLPQWFGLTTNLGSAAKWLKTLGLGTMGLKVGKWMSNQKGLSL